MTNPLPATRDPRPASFQTLPHQTPLHYQPNPDLLSGTSALKSEHTQVQRSLGPPWPIPVCWSLARFPLPVPDRPTVARSCTKIFDPTLQDTIKVFGLGQPPPFAFSPSSFLPSLALLPNQLLLNLRYQRLVTILNTPISLDPEASSTFEHIPIRVVHIAALIPSPLEIFTTKP